MASQPADKEAGKQVNLVGGIAGQTDQLIAFALKEDEKGNEIEHELGVLNLVSYAKVRNKVVLVPVNGATVPANVKQEINAVFAQSVAEWDVVIDAAYTVDPSVLEKLDEGESGMLASFPKNMRDFIQTFKKARDEDKNAYYLFIIPGKQSTRAGFMPFKRQFGFIYPANTSNTARTIAHELGHGAFRLRHTFSPEAFIAGQGKTNNLMDYPAGPELRKYQWDNVHEPESMSGWFEDDAEVAMEELSSLDVGTFDPLDPHILKVIEENISAFNVNMQNAPAKFMGRKTKVAYGRKWNARWAFYEIDQLYPNFWSEANKAKIRNGILPVVDEKYLQVIGKGLSPVDFDKLKSVAVINSSIEHHHMNHGNFAVSLETTIHKGATNTKFWHYPKFRNVASRTVKIMSQSTARSLLFIGFAIGVHEALSGDLSGAVSSMSGLPQVSFVDDVSLDLIEEGLLSDNYEKIKIGLSLLKDDRFTVGYWTADDLLSYLNGGEIVDDYIMQNINEQWAKDFPYLIVKFEGEMIGIVTIPD